MLNRAREIFRPLQLASSRDSTALAGRGGFLELRLSDSYWQNVLAGTLAAGAPCGAENLTKEDES